MKDGWKLIHYTEENETELYHLDNDEGERNDLAEGDARKNPRDARYAERVG